MALSGAHRPVWLGSDPTPTGLWADWIEERAWQDRAQCRGGAVDFFPGKDPVKIAEAVQACDGCEAIVEGAEFAIRHAEPGIWGGLTEQERKRIRRARSRR